MSKKKPVSAEEKRIRTIDYFHETKTVYSLKELESQLPKVKGIITQAVKDLVDELVYDGVVDKEKIGSGNYFFAFPRTKAMKDKVAGEQALAQEEKYNAQLVDLRAKRDALLAQRPDTEERRELLAELASVTAANAELNRDLKALGDPELAAKIVKTSATAKQAANRWTDNVFVVMGFFKNKMSDFDQAGFLKHFGLPDDFDELQ